MHMSEGVEWAAHCVLLLDCLPEGATLPASRLAEYHDVPGPYLAKSLQALAGAGIVTSIPGRRGGYRLSRPASEITLLDVVLAVEGDETLFRCTEIRRRGPSHVASRAYPPICGIAAAMYRAETAWRDALQQTTVADLAAGVLRDAPPRALDKTAAWLEKTLP
jgi:Rrf2 family protein